MIDNISNNSQIRTGVHIGIRGGYEQPYQWLWGRDRVSGIVIGWDSGDSDSRECIVELDEPLPRTEIELLTGSMTGRYLGLKLRYVNQDWAESGTVSVQLYSTNPIGGSDDDHMMVESHAKYFLIDVEKS